MTLFLPYLLSLSIGCRTPPCEPVEEIPYDGVDQDCDGTDLTDVDGDGFGLANDCDDNDATAFPGALDVAYDGEDQDCDGADLCDVDGDGFDAGVCGGADCDDGDSASFPGATEIPWDGVDQDCDGADLCDADGDGFDARSCGGTDCDDEDATAFPGAEETLADAVDQDCDDRVDEVVACPDGSGHYLTIQGAVDAAPDDGIVEVCPGTWTEPVVIVNRVLTLEGAGEMPEDTDIEAGEGYGLEVSGEWAEVTVAWVGLSGANSDRNLVQVSEGADFTITKAAINGGDGSVAWIGVPEPKLYIAPPSAVRISLCWLSGAIGVTPSDLIVVEQSVVDADLKVSTWHCYEGDCAEITFTNNIVIAGNIEYWTAVNSPAQGRSRGLIAVDHNTFSALSLLKIGVGAGVEDARDIVSPGSFSNNIIHSVSTFSVVTQIEVRSGCDNWPVESALLSFDSNLFWRSGFGTSDWTVYCYDHVGGTGIVEDDEAALSAFLADAIESDPQFCVSADQGSFGLSSSSPAINAGSGDPDPDGSPSDIGAFGGQNGDWYKEFPWPLG